MNLQELLDSSLPFSNHAQWWEAIRVGESEKGTPGGMKDSISIVLCRYCNQGFTLIGNEEKDDDINRRVVALGAE